MSGEVSIVREQRLATQRAGERPGLALRGRGQHERGGLLLRQFAATGTQVKLDALSRRREIGIEDPVLVQRSLLPLETEQRRSRVTTGELQLPEREERPDLKQMGADVAGVNEGLLRVVA